MSHLTHSELREAQASYLSGLELPAVVGGVVFRKTECGTLHFAYGNARGLIFPDNGYWGPQADGKDYYLLWRLSPHYSSELRFSPTVSPNLESAAQEIRRTWDLFCGSRR